MLASEGEKVKIDLVEKTGIMKTFTERKTVVISPHFLPYLLVKSNMVKLPLFSDFPTKMGFFLPQLAVFLQHFML